MYTRKSLIIITTTAMLSSIATYYALNSITQKKETIFVKPVLNNNKPAKVCPYKVSRVPGYEFTKPLLFGEPECETEKYADLKEILAKQIKDYQNNGTITAASVYLRDFQRADWMNINGTEPFHPGSLMKLPILISYLKKSETDYNFLSKKITFTKVPADYAAQSFTNKHIEAGKTYTVKELLEYMIRYSDNNATYLLNSNIDLSSLKKVFEEMNMVAPDFADRNITINAKEYSTFFVVLFNAGYLTSDNSEYAMELLAQTDFTQGFTAAVPQGVEIAHKFGEWSDGKGLRELHESGIIYINDKAYVLTVLTKGKSAEALPEVIKNIAKAVYDNLKETTAPQTITTGQSKTFN